MLSDSTECRKGYKGKNHKRDTLCVSRDGKDDWREYQDRVTKNDILERVFRLVEALIKGIRIITLRGVDDGGEERELDKTMSVMILGKIHVK
jgi:hypothetical protein